MSLTEKFVRDAIEKLEKEQLAFLLRKDMESHLVISGRSVSFWWPAFPDLKFPACKKAMPKSMNSWTHSRLELFGNDLGELFVRVTYERLPVYSWEDCDTEVLRGTVSRQVTLVEFSHVRDTLKERLVQHLICLIDKKHEKEKREKEDQEKLVSTQNLMRNIGVKW